MVNQKLCCPNCGCIVEDADDRDEAVPIGCKQCDMLFMFVSTAIEIKHYRTICVECTYGHWKPCLKTIKNTPHRARVCTVCDHVYVEAVE